MDTWSCPRNCRQLLAVPYSTPFGPVSSHPKCSQLKRLGLEMHGVAGKGAIASSIAPFYYVARGMVLGIASLLLWDPSWLRSRLFAIKPSKIGTDSLAFGLIQ